jgi:hypothetical protein
MAKKMIEKALRISRKLNAPDRKWLAAEVRKMLLSNEAGTSVLRSASARVPKRSAKVFISHSHKDRAFVRALVHRLEDAGIKAWLDEADLNVGEPLLDRLGAAIRQTPFLIAVLSKASLRSQWVTRELRIAMKVQTGSRRVIVLPVLKETCSVPAFLQGRLLADFTTPYRRQKNMPYLVERITRPKDAAATHAAERRR